MAEYDDYPRPSASSSTSDTPQRSNFKGKSLGQVAREIGQFVPGYKSLYGLMNTEGYGPYEALMDLQSDVVPFNDEYQYWLATGELPNKSDVAAEAALMFVPVKGGAKRAVKVNKAGKPNKSDIKQWLDQKFDQSFNLEKRMNMRDPKNPQSLIGKAEQEESRLRSRLGNVKEELDAALYGKKVPPSPAFPNGYTIPPNPEKAKVLQKEFDELSEKILNATNKTTNTTLEFFDADDIYGNLVRDPAAPYSARVEQEAMREKYYKDKLSKATGMNFDEVENLSLLPEYMIKGMLEKEYGEQAAKEIYNDYINGYLTRKNKYLVKPEDAGWVPLYDVDLYKKGLNDLNRGTIIDKSGKVYIDDIPTSLDKFGKYNP